MHLLAQAVQSGSASECLSLPAGPPFCCQYPFAGPVSRLGCEDFCCQAGFSPACPQLPDQGKASVDERLWAGAVASQPLCVYNMACQALCRHLLIHNVLLHGPSHAQGSCQLAQYLSRALCQHAIVSCHTAGAASAAKYYEVVGRVVPQSQQRASPGGGHCCP